MSNPQPISSRLDRPIRLGVLISGGGTTLVNFLQKIDADELQAEIPLVIASKDCKGVERARAAGLTCEIIPRKSYPDVENYSEEVFRQLREASVDLVTLAGFLWRLKIPADFTNRIFNIHPGLIPLFSGQGFYGHHVHEKVYESGMKLSGCTVHLVDDEYDHGPIVAQAAVPVYGTDTPDDIAARVFEAECALYPQAIRLYAEGRIHLDGTRAVIRD